MAGSIGRGRREVTIRADQDAARFQGGETAFIQG